MDFGVLGLEVGGGLTCSDTSCLTISSLSSSNEATKPKRYRSGIEHDLREFKVGKMSDDFSASKDMLLQQQKYSSLRSNGHGLLSESHQQQQQQQMLSFSSPNNSLFSTLPYSRNTGNVSGALSGGESMNGVFNGFKGPFAPSQWMELELQALIYKYISSNVPVPSYLLNPIRKAMDSAGLLCFPGLRPNTSVGWGAFQLGFSSNTDPEPGRCRRTDGKKWRCSRDAVVDAKYCERHMNRGRHRSRKPVEGQPAHSVSGTNGTSNSKLPVASTVAAMGMPGGGSSNSLSLAQHQVSNLQSGGSDPPSTSNQFDRNLLEKANLRERYHEKTNLSILSPSMSLKHQYSISKQQNAGEKSAWNDFGIVCSDSLLNPLNKSSSLVTSRNYGTAEGLNDNKSQHSLRQFMDDWPRNRTESSAVSWSNIDVHSDRAQLSISIPMANSDYVSATSSPNNNEKLANSPLRLLPELEATQMGLGVGTLVNEQNNRQANWISSSWQSSMGGPLGEVLHTSNNGTGKDTSALNLMTGGWDTSPPMASSPTGVLQKSAFCSLSNSSAGSSPRPENSKTSEGAATLCHGLLGSTLLN